MSDAVHVRRVKNPDPLLQELARQVCDQIEAWQREVTPTRQVQAWLVIRLSRDAGVPLGYVLDEHERRVRERG